VVTAAAPAALWGDLTPGPHPVGYRQTLVRDATRAYPHPLAPQARRPVLINVWYPAQGDGAALRVEDYLRVRGPGIPARDPLALLLERHVLGVFSNEVLGREPHFLDPALLSRRAQILAQPVYARRDAVARAGTHPLVLAHPGLGGAFADNFVFYEYLASQGYVVISSAFQSGEATDLNIGWEPATSVADLDLLLRWARDNLGVDGVAVMGHSYGAQAALIYAMEGRAVDAVVSLDSTLENGDPKAPWFKDGDARRVWLDRAQAITIPVLLFSTPAGTSSAFFDGLVASDRRALLVPFLEHNDLEAFGGVLGARFAYDLREPDPERPKVEQVLAAHRLVVRATHAFLEGVLRKDQEVLARLDALPATVPGAKLTHVPRAPACPRQAELLATLGKDGVEATGAHLAALAGCDVRMAFMDAADTLRAVGEQARAVEVMRWLAKRQQEDFLVQKNLGEALAGAHQYAEARTAYRRALELVSKAQVEPARRKKIFQHQLESRIQLVESLSAGGK
jgi:dienelactone hydrolase